MEWRLRLEGGGRRKASSSGAAGPMGPSGGQTGGRPSGQTRLLLSAFSPPLYPTKAWLAGRQAVRPLVWLAAGWLAGWLSLSLFRRACHKKSEHNGSNFHRLGLSLFQAERTGTLESPAVIVAVVVVITANLIVFVCTASRWSCCLLACPLAGSLARLLTRAAGAAVVAAFWPLSRQTNLLFHD